MCNLTRLTEAFVVTVAVVAVCWLRGCRSLSSCQADNNKSIIYIQSYEHVCVCVCVC